MYTKKKIQTTTRLVLALALLLPAGLIQAATPPGLVNFEGVLRDAAGVPETGTKDMVFEFYDTDGGSGCPLQGGTQLLTDSHLSGGSGGVTITDGLFNVELGGGVITAGSESSLSEVFRDNTTVYVEVLVNTETLCPRIHVTSAGYSLNADHLDGVDSSGYINTSAAAQTKAGDLTLGGDLTVSGSNLRLGDNAVLFDNYIFLDDSASPGVGPYISSVGGATLILAGDNDSDDLLLCGGAGCGDGGIQILGNSETQFIAGNGRFSFLNGAPGVFDTIAELDASGNLQIDGDLTVGLDAVFGHVFLSNGATVSAGPFIRGSSAAVVIQAGAQDTDDLVLTSGNSLDDGRIRINGDGHIEFRAGNGNFRFINGATDVDTAGLSAAGDLQLDGDLTVNGGDLSFVDETVAIITGSFADFTIGGTALFLNLGDSADDLVRVPGDLFVTGTKSFIQNHPEREDLSIAYVALEGAEAGTYTRGSGRLVGGVTRVALEETFAWTTNPEIGLTAHVTPRGESADLYVESVSTSELVVGSRDGADIAFDYVVYGLRIGHAEFPVVMGREREARVPSPLLYDKKYPGRAEFRGYTAAERFRRIDEEVWGGVAEGRTGASQAGAAQALREAIGMDDGVEPEHVYATGDDDVSRHRLAEDQLGPADAGKSPGDAARGHSAFSRGLPIDDEGNVYARSFRPSAMDLASLAPVVEPVEAGDVLIIDPEQPGMMSLAREAGDTAVFGVVAATPDAGGTVEESGTVEVHVAVSGVVFAKVDAGYGSIRPGDLLTTSPTPGHAMRADAPQIGTVLGKALEPLDVGTGLIKVLVMLR